MTNPRILIIDTDLFSLCRIYFGLIRMNYGAEACNNADEACERMQRFRPHVVLPGTAEGENLYEWRRELIHMGVRLLLLVTPGKNHSVPPADGVINKPANLSLQHQRIRTLTDSCPGVRPRKTAPDRNLTGSGYPYFYGCF